MVAKSRFSFLLIADGVHRSAIFDVDFVDIAILGIRKRFLGAFCSTCLIGVLVCSGSAPGRNPGNGPLVVEGAVRSGCGSSRPVGNGLEGMGFFASFIALILASIAAKGSTSSSAPSVGPWVCGSWGNTFLN